MSEEHQKTNQFSVIQQNIGRGGFLKSFVYRVLVGKATSMPRDASL